MAPVVPVQDEITLSLKSVFDDEDESLTSDNENRSPDDSTYVPEIVKVISSGVIPSLNSSFPLKDPSSDIKSVKPASISESITKNTQSCYSRIRDKEFAVDLTFEEKRFQLIYTEDLLTDLEILLNIIDKRYLESFLDGAGVDSLRKAFAFDLEKSLVSSETLINAPTPEEKSQETMRSKRDQTPRNIGEILIRGASAHREYTKEDRPIEIANTSSSAEVTSQGDESTVSVRITTHPRKVQTLIDLNDQEKEEEEREDELSDDMKLAYGRRREENEDSLPPPPPPPSHANISRLKEPHRVAAKGDAATAITVNQSNATEVPWNNTISMFEERLASLELRIGVFERVLEEMAKWCNLGAPATRDCLLLTQDPEFRVPGQWGSVYPEARDRASVDEHLALASDIDAVRLRGDRRRPLGRHLLPLLRKDHALGIGVLPGAEKRPEIFSDPSELQFQGYRPISPARRLGGFRMWENRRPHDYLGVSNAPQPCYRKSANRGYSVPNSWRETVLESAPAHRTVQRSVEERIVPRIVIETQINSPNNLPYEILPQDRTGNTNRGDFKRKEENFTESWDTKMQRRDSGRSRRSPERDDHGIISGFHNALSKIRYGSDFSQGRVEERFAKLFEIKPQKSEEKLVEEPRERNGFFAAAFPIIVKEFRRENDGGTETMQRRNSERKFFARNDAEASRSRYQTEAGNEDRQDSRGSLKAITSFGNSPIRIEDEISDTEYGETSEPRANPASATPSEEDFDHLYESFEPEEEDFDYTEHREYTEGEKAPTLGVGKFGKPEREVDSPRVFPRKNGSGQRIIRRTCGPVKGAEGAQRDSKFTLVWPLERREKFEAKSSSEFETNRRSEVPTSVLNPARTMEAESYNPAFPKTSGRVQNNKRKLVW